MTKSTTPHAVFITGGMSGLGRALAEVYLRRGADVAIFDLATKADVLQELEHCKLRSSQKLAVFEASVTDFNGLSDVVQQAVTDLGSPDLAINCAGMQRAAPFEQLSREAFEMVVQVNLFGSRNFTAAVLPQMRAKGAGVIVNVSSSVTMKPLPLLSVYTASKAAVNAAGKSLAMDL